MKKTTCIFLFLVLLCCVLTSCNNNDIKNIATPKTDQTNEELTIRLFAYQSKDMEPAITAYTKQYPDVKVNVETVAGSEMEPDEYTKKLTTEIMGGKGPDIVFLDDTLLKNCDIYKMMSSGVFANLDDYLKNDEDFHIEDYNQTVFKAGSLKGSQYVIPMSYAIPVFLSTESILNEADFNILNTKSFFEFANEIEKCMNKPSTPRVFSNKISMHNYYELMGAKVLDYETNTVNFDSPNIKKAAEFYKKLYAQNVMGDINAKTVAKLEDKKILFADYSRWLSFNSFFTDSSIVSTFDKPMPIALRDVNGGVQAQILGSMAIRNNSANIQNAYNFIQIAMSSEVVEKSIGFDIPIRNSSAKYFIDEYTKNEMTLEDTNGNIIQPPKFSQEYGSKHMEIIKSVSGAYFRNSWGKKFYSIMEPFYNGEKTYEECIVEAQSQLEIYITE